MILYFKEKSKVYAKWSILTIIFLIEMYFVFIYTKISLRNIKTLQIIRIKTDIFKENLVEKPIFNELLEKGDKAFVASKIGKYYYPVSCSKSKSLSVKNTLYFKDKMSAEAAGFKPYNGCF